MKAGKLKVIYNIKTSTIDTLAVSNSNIPKSIESINIQVARHFSRASSQLNVRSTWNTISKVASFPCHSGCSNSLEPGGVAEQLSVVRWFLGQMGGPSWFSQEWPTKVRPLASYSWSSWHATVSGSYLQSRRGSASWLSMHCTSWNAHNSFQTIWHSF